MAGQLGSLRKWVSDRKLQTQMLPELDDLEARMRRSGFNMSNSGDVPDIQFAVWSTTTASDTGAQEAAKLWLLETAGFARWASASFTFAVSRVPGFRYELIHPFYVFDASQKCPTCANRTAASAAATERARELPTELHTFETCCLAPQGGVLRGGTADQQELATTGSAPPAAKAKKQNKETPRPPGPAAVWLLA